MDGATEAIREAIVRKVDEITKQYSCLNKAKSNELVFVLLGRDAAAPTAIRAWVERRIQIGLNEPGDAEVIEALDVADKMDRERNAIRASI
jgi:hypothetical protein